MLDEDGFREGVPEGRVSGVFWVEVSLALVGLPPRHQTQNTKVHSPWQVKIQKIVFFITIGILDSIPSYFISMT